jgi:uncharacterized protein YbjT (DUF2867 family)
MSLHIMVTGATGSQGGAVARLLLKNGHKVKGLTRNPNSEKAQGLKNAGAEIVRGDFEDVDSLTSAARGCDTIFIVGTPFEKGVEAETAMASNAVRAAVQADVDHIVYSSVADADKNTHVPHFDSKYEVEKLVTSLDTTYTIVAPAFFYENFFSPFIMPGLQQGAYAQALPAERPLQSISLTDIAAFTVYVIENKERFANKRINIAGDELTGTQYAEALSKVSSKQIGYTEVPIEQVRSMSEDMAAMYEWFKDPGYDVDIAGLKKNYPEIPWTSFSEWAGNQDWSAVSAS